MLVINTWIVMEKLSDGAANASYKIVTVVRKIEMQSTLCKWGIFA